MTSLLDTPNEEQQHLLDVIYRGYKSSGGWPVFDYVDRTLYREFRLDAKSVILSCPLLAMWPSTSIYGWLFADRADIRNPDPSCTVGLTVAGMHHMPQMEGMTQTFLLLLGMLVDAEESSEPSPTKVVTFNVSVAEFDDIFKVATNNKAGDHERTSQFMRLQLRHEPGTWHSVPNFDDLGGAISLSPAFRDFRGVAQADDYVQRLVDRYTPTQQTEFAHPSSLSLPEAIDYLNLAWQVHCKAQLFSIMRADAVAQLSLECISKEELSSRLSALVTILGKAHVPGVKETRLLDLENYVTGQLDDDGSRERVKRAVTTLKAINDLRIVFQHVGTDLAKKHKWAEDELGVKIASGDWTGIWDTVRQRCTAALGAIREEAENLPEYSG